MAYSIILLTIFLGPMVTITSSHLLMMWAGLEMNTLAMIPILLRTSNPRAIEAAAKYFLIQSTASMILLLSITLNFHNLGIWQLTSNTQHYIFYLMLVALMMKLGLAPFHFWVPEVTQAIPILSGLLLLTWQKIAPLIILYNISYLTNPPIIPIAAIFSILAGGWGGLNQTQMRKILAYSSIAHMGWMIAVSTYNPTMMLLNLIIYISLTICMFFTIYILSITSISLFSKMWSKAPLMITTSLIILLSLGGLPPLTGFLPKWMIILELTKNHSIFMATTMAMMALLNLFFYMRLIYAASMTIFPSNNNSKPQTHQNKQKYLSLLAPLIIISSTTLPISPLLVNLF
nr:NADH dehydrogenase subunit 2 [Tachyoryctes macrocephalus]WJZ50641.1 NADH dehydrogenase subunit 2 [Tachyoryctes macrocephalus]WJZ50654.1 NADH dehydrogenase subunit 2 [Tachyoryctes macrocephalus]WJZ50667.1 NADH dehydrogenase subunit 2 [Tachyoryctes macrocephalus]WJZ50680.1 NADH dehydrogenase subunit 2 [Tachyoryctes macrocephalus]